MDEITPGAAETFGVTTADAWMAGWLAAERGNRGPAPCWLLPSDRVEWTRGQIAYRISGLTPPPSKEG